MAARRFEELDSLRGIAAVAVIFNHCLNTLPAIVTSESPANLRWLVNSPLHMFWGGHEAVLFFFVLSGFVLSIPFFSRPVKFLPFLVKRICRIYIPYIAAVSIAMALRMLLSREGIPELSRWVNATWVDPVSLKAVAEHFLLIDSFKNWQFDPVIWSLVHEMRVSIFFPLLMVLVVRTNWKVSLAVGFVISAVAHYFTYYHSSGPFDGTDYLHTFRYIVMFVVGALLAKHREPIMKWYCAIRKPVKYGLVVLACLMYTYKWWFIPESNKLHISYVNELMVTAGVIIFVVTGLSARAASNLLTSKPLVFTGRVSYSIYLFHAIILLTLLNLLYGVVPLWTIWVLTFVLTFPISGLAFKYLEAPSISIGRTLSNRMMGKQGNG